MSANRVGLESSIGTHRRAPWNGFGCTTGSRCCQARAPIRRSKPIAVNTAGNHGSGAWIRTRDNGSKDRCDTASLLRIGRTARRGVSSARESPRGAWRPYYTMRSPGARSPGHVGAGERGSRRPAAPPRCALVCPCRLGPASRSRGPGSARIHRYGMVDRQRPGARLATPRSACAASDGEWSIA
jgi:hypothetical protein